MAYTNYFSVSSPAAPVLSAGTYCRQIASFLHTNPHAWTRGVYARTAGGDPCATDDHGAAAFCMLGLLMRLVPDKDVAHRMAARDTGQASTATTIRGRPSCPALAPLRRVMRHLRPGSSSRADNGLDRCRRPVGRGTLVPEADRWRRPAGTRERLVRPVRRRRPGWPRRSCGRRPATPPSGPGSGLGQRGSHEQRLEKRLEIRRR